MQRRTIPYENYDLSDHPGIGSGQVDVYAAFLFSKSRVSIPDSLRKFMNPYSAEKRKSPHWKKSTGYSTAKMKRMPTIWKRSVSPDIPCQSLTFWKYRTRRQKAASISVIRLAFLKYHFRRKAPCCPSKIMIISLMSRSAGPSPVIWPIWITGEFLFIPVSRSSSNAANTVSASSATGSVTGRRKGYPHGRKNFWSVLLSFCSRIRKGRLRKIYGITALTLRFGSPSTQHTAR